MFPVIFLFVFLSFLCASTGSHPPMRREQPGEAYSNIEAILESNSSRSSNQEPIRPIMVRDTQTSGSSHSSRLGEPDFIPVTESRFPDANLKMKLNLDCKRFFSLESEHDLSILMSKMSLRGRNWTDLTLLEECRDAFVPRCHLLRSKHIEEILDPKAIDQKENLIPEDDRVRLRFERLFQIGCAQKIVPWSAVSSQKHFDMVKNVLRVDLISNWINFKPKMLTSLICHQIKDRINRGDTTAFELPPINSEDYASYDKLSALFILMRLIVPDIHIWPYILTPDIISFVSRARSEDCCSHLSEMLLQLASEINEPSSKLIIKFPIIFFKQILSRKFSSFDFFRKFVTKLASMDWLSENQPIYILSYLKAFADARIPLGNQSIILADIFKYSDIIFSTEMNLFMTDDSGDCSQYQTLYWKTFIPSPNGKLAHVQLSSQESRNSQSLASSSSSIQDIDMNQTPESIGTDYSVFQKVIRDSINSATALALKDIKRSEELKRFLEGFGSIYSAPQDVDNWIEQEIQDTEIQIYSIPSSSIYPSSALRWLSKLSALLHGLFIKLGNSPNLPPNFLFHDWGELDSAQIFDHVTDLIDDRKTSFLYVNYVIIQLHVSRLTKTISNNQETKKTIFEGLVRQLNTFKNNNGNQWPLMPAACVLAQTEADFRQLVIKRHPVIKNMTYFHIDMRQSSSHSDDDPQFSHSREPRIIAPIEFYVERTMLQLVTNEIIFAHPWTILHVDGAIDQGGPLRGWLSDMLTYMADPENKIIISLSDTDLITRKFAWMVDPTVGFFCGAIISKAIQKGVTLPITLDPEFFELLKMPSSRAIDKYYDQTYISSEERVLFEERMLQKWPKSVYDQLDYELFTFPRPDSLVLTGLPLNGAKNIKTNIWNAMIKDTYGQNIPPYEEIPAIHRALCAIGRSVFHDFVNQFNRGLQLCLQLDAMQMSMNHSIACLINERELNVEQFLLAIRYEEGPISSLLLVDSLIPGHPISLRNTFESFLRALDRQQLGKMIALWTGASGLCDLNTTHVPSVYFYHPQSESNMIVARFLPIYLKPHQITKMYPIEDINLSTSTSLKRKMPDVLENTSFSSSSAGPHVSTGISTNETSEGQLAINTDQRKLELSKTVVQSIGDLDEDSEDLDYEKETNKIQTINKNYDMDPGLSGAIIIDDRQFVRIVRAVAKEQCLILGLSCDQRVDPFESKNPTFADGVAYPTKFSTCPRIIQVPVGTAGQIVHTLLLSLNMCVRDFKD